MSSSFHVPKYGQLLQEGGASTRYRPTSELPPSPALPPVADGGGLTPVADGGGLTKVQNEKVKNAPVSLADQWIANYGLTAHKRFASRTSDVRNPQNKPALRAPSASAVDVAVDVAHYDQQSQCFVAELCKFPEATKGLEGAEANAQTQDQMSYKSPDAQNLVGKTWETARLP
eukprot:CAMPEP_0206033434 /NCGR_PEP_ID=MMETSP1466-20131121/648_1 /ASSEMBLY_ACC=CAM_ASM_001126 /TAXON_ID=44452 /ORGANISM="Pavlova gyrans, Strain CCMP608" /LENGTH=172 /DNA_ID=CAMNT_0053407627 /DNA_START=308 /DNA_END=824 /DNA_ORIENTATION=+